MAKHQFCALVGKVDFALFLEGADWRIAQQTPRRDAWLTHDFSGRGIIEKKEAGEGADYRGRCAVAEERRLSDQHMPASVLVLCRVIAPENIILRPIGFPVAH